eukprot:TRINITY_DN18413_c0_g1_i1.p1 TRINITY_DN18413_c0_g1~~TRINITY_DN18413_c0_g1_i1.p1  ORF type:complete len:360 (+),score=111.73 TRINITY_DN18413_c0_g1_i1:84-1082(+)
MAAAPGLARRAAVDIGSGGTKLLIADVDAAARWVNKILAGKVLTVPYGDAFARTGTLKGEVLDKGLGVTAGYAADIASHGVPPGCVAAIATEVFRAAGADGEAALGQLGAKLGCQVRLIPQEAEAALGLRTVQALIGLGSDGVVWDSGGGSFQITQSVPSGVRSYSARVGYAHATAELRVLQGRDAADATSPNPVSSELADRLVGVVRGRVPEAPPWLQGAKDVVGIGDDGDFFHIVAQIRGEPAAGPEGQKVTRYAASEARRALAACVGKTDEEILSAFPLVQAEEVCYIVPKLALMCAVVDACQFTELRALVVDGCCAGLLISDEYYAQD